MSAAIATPIALGFLEAILGVVKHTKEEAAAAKKAALDYAANPTPVKHPDLAARYGSAFDRATAPLDHDTEPPDSPPMVLPEHMPPSARVPEPEIIPDEYIEDDPSSEEPTK